MFDVTEADIFGRAGWANSGHSPLKLVKSTAKGEAASQVGVTEVNCQYMTKDAS